jgi:hypothetical protein
MKETNFFLTELLIQIALSNKLICISQPLCSICTLFQSVEFTATDHNSRRPQIQFHANSRNITSVHELQVHLHNYLVSCVKSEYSAFSIGFAILLRCVMLYFLPYMQQTDEHTMFSGRYTGRRGCIITAVLSRNKPISRKLSSIRPIIRNSGI